MPATIARAPREDPAHGLVLPARHGLPVDGASTIGESLVVARLAGRIVSAAGLELYAQGALVRSVVVDARVQGQGLGQRLTEAALALARARTDTCAGVRLVGVPGLLVARLAGAATATATLPFRWLVPSLPEAADRVVVPRSQVSAP
jgi:GNAT superfamily N-acetyltransferase